MCGPWAPEALRSLRLALDGPFPKVRSTDCFLFGFHLSLLVVTETGGDCLAELSSKLVL